MSTECSAAFITVCVDPFTPSTNSQNAGPTAKIEGVTNSSQAAEALLTCFQALFTPGGGGRRALTEWLTTVSAKLGVTVLAVLVPPSLAEWLVLPDEAGPKRHSSDLVQPGVIVGSSLAGVAVLGLLCAVAGYLYLLKKRKSETTPGVKLTHATDTKAVAPTKEPDADEERF